MCVNHKTIGELDSYLFFEGTHTQSYNFMGAHESGDAWDFVLWAPNARAVSVIGDFNDWACGCNMMEKVHDNGLWFCSIKSARTGHRYRYAIRTLTEETIEKCDPYARDMDEHASILVPDTTYDWQDDAWLAKREKADHKRSPMSIYEVVPSAWMENLTWKKLADKLCAYVLELGYTHVALTPQCRAADPMGYHVTGYFAADKTLGEADDLKYFIEKMHQNGIGVIMDFVPAKFAAGQYGLSLFDGSPCYEAFAANLHNAAPQAAFNYGRNEVRSFLSSAANFWANEFHVDALRICGVSEVIYHNFGEPMTQYARSEQENHDGITLLRFINDSLHKQHHGFICIAHEETTYPLVTAPPYAGGLGFDYKWNLGWTSDTLQFMQDDPVYHPYHHNALTFPMMYAFSENHILPLSHVQMAGGRRTYLSKMSGGYAYQAAQLRLLLGYQFTHPGKKLSFMGTEIGMQGVWNAANALPFEDADAQLQAYVKRLNLLYKNASALYACDDSWDGYRWLNANDADRSVLSYMRMDADRKLIVLCNFSPVKWNGYQVPLAALPEGGKLSVVLNSDAEEFGGSDSALNVELIHRPVLDQPFGFSIDLPAFATIVLAYNS